MFEPIVHAEPIAIMLDRSRDAGCGEAVRWLRPLRVFRTTDNRRRLSTARLRDYDILVVCATGKARHNAAECRAIKDFVRRGGSLLLAASEARFERDTGMDVDRLAAQQIASLFGYTFLSVRDLPADLYALRGLAPEDIHLTAAGKRFGVRDEYLLFERPGPIAPPAGAKVLLRSKGGSCVAALSKHGKGRVLVMGDTEWIAEQRNYWCVTHWLTKLAPVPRRSARYLKRNPDGRVPEVIPQSYEVLERGTIKVSFTRADSGRAAEVLELADLIWKEARRVIGSTKKPQRWSITLNPGCCSNLSWPSDTSSCTHLGMCAGRGAMIAALAETLCKCWVLDRVEWQWRAFLPSMVFHFTHHVLQKFGEGEYAAMLENACSGGDPIDLGRLYPDSRQQAPQRRFWIDLERAWGVGTVRQMWKAIPKKDAFKYLDSKFYTELDQIAYFLALVKGPKIHAWLRRQGHTVKRIPLRDPASDALRDAIQRDWVRLLMNPEEPASDRYDALRLLGERWAAQKRSLDQCAKSSLRDSPRRALPAIARLVQVRDERGAAAARRFLRSADHGLAAVVALVLAFETRDRRALDTLVRLAPAQDVRFQTSVGYALYCADDRRAGRFAFEKLPGCTMKTEYQYSMKKVFLTVDGYAVAHVWCIPYFFDMPYKTAFSTWYVEWVHTALRWRRRGLARLGMTVCLDEPYNRECATTSLHTGTRNIAHTLYRQFGLHDVWVMHVLERYLADEKVLKAPRNITVRVAKQTDMAIVNDFLMRRRIDKIMEPVRLSLWPHLGPALVAYDGKQLVGVASAHLGSETAHLEFIEVDELKPKKSPRRKREANLGETKNAPLRRERVGLVLLNRLHRELRRQGQKRITTEIYASLFDDFLFQLVRHAGYATHREGAVELQRINDLAQLLDELKHMFTERLQRSEQWKGWSGSIDLEGEGLRARMEFAKGELSVTQPWAMARGRRVGRGRRKMRASSPAIAIRGSRASITKVVFGYASAFEEHMQIQLETVPSPTAQVTGLIETIFPRVVRE